jgi:hypothetical protein
MASQPQFVVPSLMWYGLEPRSGAPSLKMGVNKLTIDDWGGQFNVEDDVKKALEILDPTVLLLNLAGYQTPELVLAVPTISADTSETSLKNLLSVDIRTMVVDRGTSRSWFVPEPASKRAVVALWVEPRYPGTMPAVATGATLRFEDLVPTSSTWIGLDFSNDGTGWLRLSWPASEAGTTWDQKLIALVMQLNGALVSALAGQDETARLGGPQTVRGLLGIYDPVNWALLDPALPIHETIPVLEEVARAINAIIYGVGGAGGGLGLLEFLRQEIAPAPVKVMTVTKRLEESGQFEPRDLIEKLSTCADEVVHVCTDRTGVLDEEATAERDGFIRTVYRDFSQLTYTQLLMRWHELAAFDILAPIRALAGPSDYGGYELRLHDQDGPEPVYGGTARSHANGDRLPRTPELGYVAQLRKDLATLGFGPLFDWSASEPTSAKFEIWLERAVRELQIYGKMPAVARQGEFTGVFYADTLDQVPNDEPYAGPVSGVVDADTRALIARWLTGRLRCPVVIEARLQASDGTWSEPVIGAAYASPNNLWRNTQVQSKVPRMFARDLTGYFDASVRPIPAGDPDTRTLVGSWSYLDKNKDDYFNESVNESEWNGPVSLRPHGGFDGHVWRHLSGPITELSTTEVLPETLLGKGATAMTPAERSTFRVVRAVSEQECGGYLDSLNAYDNALISTGPYHWTIAILFDDGTTAKGELAAYLAYLKGLGADGTPGIPPRDQAAGEAFDKTFGFFGCDVDREWRRGTSQAGAGSVWVSSQGKYAAWVKLQRDDGMFETASTKDHTVGEWFRSWHWFYRFQMATRTISAFRRRMWDFARIRVRDVSGVIYGTDGAGRQVMNGANAATVGDVFSSEQAIAMIIRWHVKWPTDVIGEPIRDVCNPIIAGFASADTSTWGDLQQEALIEALRQNAVSTGRVDLSAVFRWPAWSVANNSGRFVLGLADVVEAAPTFAGLTTSSTAKNTPAVVQFTVGAAIGPPTATSANQALLPNANIVVAQTGANFTLTMTPAQDATGSAIVTVRAENAAHVATHRFYLLVGAAEGSALAQAPRSGLSWRARTFTLDTTGLPP